VRAISGTGHRRFPLPEVLGGETVFGVAELAAQGRIRIFLQQFVDLLASEGAERGVAEMLRRTAAAEAGGRKPGQGEFRRLRLSDEKREKGQERGFRIVRKAS